MWYGWILQCRPVRYREVLKRDLYESYPVADGDLDHVKGNDLAKRFGDEVK